MRGRVLVVDDEPSMCELLAASLRAPGLEITTRTSAEGVLDEVGAGSYDVVLTDLRMKGISGIQLCNMIVQNYPQVPVIVMTAFGSLDTAVEAMRAGAYDFLAKPFKTDVVTLALQRALRQRRLEDEILQLRQRLERARPFEEILGESDAIQELCQVLERVARGRTSILICGETGTGKELVARAIHRRGPRSKRPFVAINCAAMPEALLESELFGHARGAFTDAKQAREGLFQRANGGTLFLDEIGDMPLGLQVKLLRILQERMVRPLGCDQETPVDVRLLAATHQDLEEGVKEGRFREDLLYRVNVIRLDVPPLRTRGNDVLLLAQHFAQHFAKRSEVPVRGFTSAVGRRLLEYDWPGNVRELSNCIERAVALTTHDELVVEDLPPKLRDYQAPQGPPPGPANYSDSTDLVPLSQIERSYILRVLQAVGGNKARAARILGLDRKTLYRRLDQYGQAGHQTGPSNPPLRPHA
ncbi:MAG: sigma-54-dependent Fis family transcriptional regulator [Planctomycetes bacterium]|nr:sigma-54-dependent Fis family transcriptional regulator [Planctomycetota bacterium]